MRLVNSSLWDKVVAGEFSNNKLTHPLLPPGVARHSLSSLAARAADLSSSRL